MPYCNEDTMFFCSCTRTCPELRGRKVPGVRRYLGMELRTLYCTAMIDASLTVKPVMPVAITRWKGWRHSVYERAELIASWKAAEHRPHISRTPHPVLGARHVVALTSMAAISRGCSNFGDSQVGL